MDTDSGVATIERTKIAELAATVSGPVLLPDDDGYAAECAIYNLNLVLEPAVVVGASGEPSDSRRSTGSRSRSRTQVTTSPRPRAARY